MRVCQVGTGFTSIPPQISAATEEVICNLSRELLALKCNVTIIDVLNKKRQPSGLPIIELPYFSFIKSTKSNSPSLIVKRLSFSFFSTIWLNRFKRNFDVLHFHNQFPASLFLYSKLPSKKNPVTVFTVHNPIWGLSASEIPKNVSLKFALEVAAMKMADKVIVVSETLKRNIIEHLKLEPTSIAVIHNGVDTNLFSQCRASSTLRNKLAPKGEKIVLCVGRISRFKGQKTLVDSIPMIVKKNPNVKFVFVGPIDDIACFEDISNAIESMSLRNFCMFTGTVASDLIPEYFATADICVVLSITEAGPPLTLLQAMSSARAIVASEIPQNKEASKRGDEMVFVDPLNIEEISAVIVHLLADENIRKSMGEKARETALESYDWKVTAKETLHLYENLKRN